MKATKKTPKERIYITMKNGEKRLLTASEVRFVNQHTIPFTEILGTSSN